MKQHSTFSLLLGCALTALSAGAARPIENPDSFYVPERAVMVSGNRDTGRDLVAVLYDKTDMHYSEPNAPRFLFLDREGKVALGIGGYLKGTVQYDFDGSIDDGASFITYDIPVPNDPAQRSGFYGNVNHSTIFLRLVGRSTKFGLYQMYVQTNFSGNGTTGYGVKVKQAWASLGNVTMGLANSTFVDGSAGTPVIDDQGPGGEASCKNVLVRYVKTFGHGWRVAAGVEMPGASYTVNTDVEKISQRVPDVPVNLQYAWGGSHIRLTGMLRNLAYRDLVSEQNHIKTGWAVQLSGVQEIGRMVNIFYQGAYGRGYGHYVNDLSEGSFDLVYDHTAGKMTAPKLCNFEVGARVDFTPNCFMSAAYSQARTFGLGYLGGDTFRYSQYLSVSGFYDIIEDLRIGVEYLHGNRKNYNHESGKANRIMAMLQYSF